ncbi:MAG: divergent PAP2 family protein [Anaerolineales bacterium]|nr:MAG: divergent PAP2 family protein [Anaerolineales bacterium]
MTLSGIFSNYALLAGLIAWAIAQIIKVPLEYLQTRTWNWALLLRAGGMPSSHSALVTGVAHAIGLFYGFDTPQFALSVAITMVVVYDSTGIRRQAGIHAALINAMINDLAHGHPLKGEQLREVLGHTPLEAVGGVILGLLVAQIAWFLSN